MTWNYLWYSIVGLGILIIIGLILSKRKKVMCNHNFVPRGYINVNETVRMIMICKKCGQSVHSPVPSKKQLKEREEKLYEQYFRD